MAVVSEYRGQGVGSQLLGHLLQAADDHYRAVSLSVSADNPALRLYHRFGFVVVGKGGQSLVMKREGVRPRVEGVEPGVAPDPPGRFVSGTS
jgi:ribosomal protein S18 acetylase RimI-like enzyme